MPIAIGLTVVTIAPVVHRCNVRKKTGAASIRDTAPVGDDEIKCRNSGRGNEPALWLTSFPS